MDTTSHQATLELKRFRGTNDLRALESASDLVDSMQVGQGGQSSDLRKFHREELALWLRVLNAIDERLDPKFDPNDLPALSVAPPPGAQVPAGADPNSISDPKEREPYLHSININQEKTAHYSFQYKLRKLNEQISDEVATYVRASYLGSPEEKNEFLQLVDEIAVSPRRKASLRSLATTP